MNYPSNLSTVLEPLPNDPTQFQRSGLLGQLSSQYQSPFSGPKKYAYNGSKDVAGPVMQGFIKTDPRTVPGVYREPTRDNPLMNYPLTAYDEPETYSDYNRYQKYDDALAVSTNAEVKRKLTGNMHQTPGDFLFHHESQPRQFFSNNVGGGSPDTVEFAENLYGIKNVCKAGSIYMHTGLLSSDDSKMCNGYNAASATGFGNIR
jgi:hypothetical protein